MKSHCVNSEWFFSIRNMKSRIFVGVRLIFLVTLFLFSMCRGQNVSKASKPPSEQLTLAEEVGTLVAEIEGNPNPIFQDRQLNYWLGVKGKGVYKYNPTAKSSLIVYSEKDGLCSDDILGIQEDQAGNIYFDTFEGVCKFNGKQFQSLEVIDSPSAWQDWKLEPTDMWFRMGWDHPGPFRYDGEYLYALHFPKPAQADIFKARYPNAAFNPYGIYSVYQDRKGVIWFGTSSLGLARYDGNSVDWLYEDQLTNTPSGGAFGIRSILEDEEGYFWFNNSRRRYKVLAENLRKDETNYIQYQQEDGVGYEQAAGEMEFPYFLSMAEDEAGDLWGVTYQDGVWQKQGDELIHHPIKTGGTEVSLFSIYKDRQGILWLVTHEDGLYKYNGKEFKKFKLEN